MKKLPLRSFRGLNIQEGGCSPTRDMSLGRFVRIVTRSMVAVSAYDKAMVGFCKNRFDTLGIHDMPYRHEVCFKLRGTIACSVLWGVFLDSESFQNAYRSKYHREPPLMRDPNTDPSPNVFSNFIGDVKAPTLQELQHKNTVNSVRQQTRLILRKAKEVDLVDYTYVTPVKSLVFGTENLFRFFTENLSDEMDRQ